MESPGTRALGVAAIALGVVLAALLAWRLRTAAHPLIPREAFASRPLRQGTGLSFANTATTSSSAVLAALYLQDELRIGPVASGLTLMALSVAVVLTSATTGTVLARLAPHRLAVLGLGSIAVGQFVLAATLGSWWGVLVGVALAGAGLGPASVAATSIGTSVAERLMGSASGILNTGAQVGTALGTAAIILVASLGGYALGWLVAGVAAALTAGWCLLPRTVSAPGSTGR
jgi:predicted MFS family arabinose efflux permease